MGDEQAGPVRIAMWSGPRNISTAMMRSWGSRADAACSDEPLYAHYLNQTGLGHPGRDRILVECEADAGRVIEYLTGPVPGGKPIWYQKHMAHHLLPSVPRGWIGGLRNVLLIREPEAMVISLAKVLGPAFGPEETGLPQQAVLDAELTGATGSPPPVIDAKDVLEQPEAMLRALCRAVGVPFDPAMLSWEAGPKPEDGVWAEHWYANVWRSTGFASYIPRTEDVPVELRGVAAECRAIYEPLHARRLRPD